MQPEEPGATVIQPEVEDDADASKAKKKAKPVEDPHFPELPDPVR